MPGEKIKKVVVLFREKKLCSGCTACCAVCPRDAIRMVSDEEGFDYPEIREELCVHCDQCRKVCPIQKADNGMEA